MLTTLETVKSDLGIANTEFDAFLTRKIKAVSEKIERFCNRKFREQEYTEIRKGNYSRNLVLTYYPIINVEYVKVNDSDIEDYEIFEREGILYRKNGLWSPESLKVGISNDPLTENYNIEVKYTAGYVLPGEDNRNLPYDLEEAAIEAVKAEYYQRNDNVNIESEKLQSYQAKYHRSGLPVTVIETLKSGGWVSYV